VTPGAPDAEVGHLLRELGPQVLAAVARRHYDFTAAEDAVQEALIAAARQWPVAGLPDNPGAWLYRVTVRRLADRLRGESARRRREEAVASRLAADETVAPPPDHETGPDGDDSLLLLYMCCHPALTPASAIALTLRAVGGLSTGEIASAFLVPEATMAQRISRAKATIKASGVPFQPPGDDDRTTRLGAVLHVLYLMFSEGYVSSSGSALQRIDLSNEAIRLTRAVRAQLPGDAEVAGLLALLLLTDARRAARTGPAGELIPLDEQDRSLWDRRLVDEGTALLHEALRRGAVGPYQIQAAIAALHDEAPTADATDWPQVLALYGLLRRMTDNPMVALNHAIATAMTHGPAAGLKLLAVLDADPRLAGHYRLDAVRGHLYERAGRREQAVAHFRLAAERTASIPERDYLLTRAARLSVPSGTPLVSSG
jgi:RNA polymerase sigma factor (sigma-70 family)